MGGCPNFWSLLDPYNTTAPSTFGTRKGTTVSSTTHMGLGDIELRRDALKAVRLGAQEQGGAP